MTKREQEQKALEAFSETRARMVSFKVPNVDKAAILFFASLILRLEPKVDWKIQTACTDGDKIWINPDWFLSLTQMERFTVCCHEVAHLAQLHHLRQGDRPAERWNVACDLAINSWLLHAGFQFPEKAYIPRRGKFSHFEPDLSAEEYDDLLQKQDKGDGDDGQQPGGGGGGGGGGQQPQQQPQQQQQDGEDDDGDSGGGAGGGESDGGGEGDQQGADGGDQPPDSSGPGDAPDPGGCGSVTEPPADEAERSEKEGKTKVAVAQAAQAAKSQGKAPAWLDRLVESVLNPKEDWREVLREFVTRQARNEYSYQRPNRRYLQQGLIMPSLRGEELGDLIITVDCSGSISQKDLDVFAGEVMGIVDTYSCKVTILYHDVPVTHVQQWEPNDGPLKLKPHGGGGTSHVPVFEYINSKLQDDDAPCVVCFTDLYTDFPSKAPRLPVLWAVYGEETTYYRRPSVPFGRVINVKG